MRTICRYLLLKIGVPFDGIVIMKEVFSYSSKGIETHLDVVVLIIKTQSSVSFLFYIDEELVEF